MECKIIPLDQRLIHLANSNSFGERGDRSNATYQAYGQEILEWPISDAKKEKLLKELHRRYSVVLNYQAKHISVVVAGPAGYNSRTMDFGDDVLRSTAEFCDWFDELRKQIERATRPERDKAAELVEWVRHLDEKGIDPRDKLGQIASVDNALFVQLFEELNPKYRWRKNSVVYKLYVASKEGRVKEIRKEVFFEDENFTAYREGNRAYIRFMLRPKRQLIVALKSRGWWWNSNVDAWSTYLHKVDEEWVKSISTRYADYI